MKGISEIDSVEELGFFTAVVRAVKGFEQQRKLREVPGKLTAVLLLFC